MNTFQLKLVLCRFGARIRRRTLPLAVVVAIAALATGCGQTDTRWNDPSRRVPKPRKDNPVVETLREEVQKNPRSAEAHVRLGMKYLEMERYREAEDSLMAANIIEPNHMLARLGRWQIYSRLTDPTNTVVLAVGVTRLDPRDPIAEVILKEGAKAFDRALVTRDRDSWVLYHAAVTQAKLGDWDKAQEHAYRASVGLHTSPHLVFTDILLQLGQAERASAELQKITKPDAATFEATGRVHEARGNYEAALRSYERASQLRPDWHVPVARSGFLCLRLKRLDLALEFFRRAEKISPTDENIKFAIAEVTMLSGDDGGAMALYEKILETSPDNSIVLNNLAHLLSKKTDQLGRALEVARRAEAADPLNVAAKSTLGWILFLEGKHNEALPYLRLAARSMSDLGVANYQLGKVLIALNRRDEALIYFRLALERGLPPDEQKEAEGLIGKP